MEKSYLWTELNHQQQKFVVDAQALTLKTDKKAMLTRVFDIGNPRIILGESEKPYCRIHLESV